MGRGVIDMHLGTQALRGELGAMRGMIVKGAAVAGAAAAAALTVAITKSVVIFASFEQAMARVKAITGATAEEYAALEQKSRDLGRTTQFTASQAAQAMGFFAQAGLTVREMLDAMAPTLNLAAAGQLDMATAASIVSKVMRGMKLEAGDLTHVVDVLTKAFVSSNTDLIQLGEAMKFAAPVAASIGKEIEEVTAAIMAMSDAGLQGTIAGTTLRNVLMKLANPSKQAAKLLQDYNIQIKTTGGSLKSLPALVDEFGRRLHSLGEADKLGVLGQIFEMRAATGFIQLLGVGGDRLREFERTLADAGGTAERVATVQMDTLRGSWLRLKSAIEAGAIALGEGLAPALRDVTEGMVEFIATTGPALVSFGRELASVLSSTREALKAIALITGVADIWEMGPGGAIKQKQAIAAVNKELKEERTLVDDIADAMKAAAVATDTETDAVRRLQNQLARFFDASALWRHIQQGLIRTTAVVPAAVAIDTGNGQPQAPPGPPRSRWADVFRAATAARSAATWLDMPDPRRGRRFSQYRGWYDEFHEMDATDQPATLADVLGGEGGLAGDI